MGHITHLVNLALLSFAGNVGLPVLILNNCRGLLNDALVDLSHVDSIVAHRVHFLSRGAVLLGSELQQVLTVQVALGCPPLLAETEIVILLRKLPRVSSFAGVFLGTAAPRDIGTVNLLVGILTLFDTSGSESLTVISGDVADQLVK